MKGSTQCPSDSAASALLGAWALGAGSWQPREGSGLGRMVCMQPGTFLKTAWEQCFTLPLGPGRIHFLVYTDCVRDCFSCSSRPNEYFISILWMYCRKCWKCLHWTIMKFLFATMCVRGKWHKFATHKSVFVPNPRSEHHSVLVGQ